MKICKACGIVLMLLLSACTVNRADYFNAASDVSLLTMDQGAINEKTLRVNYCAELFLTEGYDVSSKQSGTGLTEDVKIYEQAYQLCLVVPAVKAGAAPGSTDGFFPTNNLGLALSGGGTRSGSFSIGVLKALNEIDVTKSGNQKGDSLLRQVDAISSVSGGGYATYWYLMQNYNRLLDHAGEEKVNLGDRISMIHQDIFRTRGDSDIFGDTKYQDHIATHSYLLYASSSPWMHPVEDFWIFAGQIGSIPAHWIGNGLFDWHTNTSVESLAYQQGIERTYGLSTRKDYSPYSEACRKADCQYYNAKSGKFAIWNDDAQADSVSFGQYREFLREQNSSIHKENAGSDSSGKAANFTHPLPFPIINTTMGKRTKKLSPLDHAVFTFTPLSNGSGLGGYTDDQEVKTDVDLSKAYAISGAALDANARETGLFLDLVLWLADANLGYRYPNNSKNVNQVSLTLNQKLHYLPFGLYHLQDRLTPDAYKAWYRLSDGGQSENLGFYSLIKRGARHVIVVDAGQDNEYQFEDLQRLKVNIKTEMHLDLTLEAGLDDKFQEKRNPAPVFTGKITGLNVPNGGSRDIDFVYIKLALGQDEYDRIRNNKEYQCSLTTDQIKNYVPAAGKPNPPLPCSVVDYIRSEKPDMKNRFPHNSTADIFYDDAQYRAYRDLGYYAVMTEMRPKIAADATGAGWLHNVMNNREIRFKYFNELVKKAKEGIGGENTKI